MQLVWLDDGIHPVETTGEGLHYSVSMKAPQDGSFLGFYIQFEFPGEKENFLVDFGLTTNTQVVIVPNKPPFPDCDGDACGGPLV